MDEQMTLAEAAAEGLAAVDEHRAVRTIVEGATPREEIAVRDARSELAREAYKDTPVFEAVWEAIKGWDIERSHGEGYSGATGTDVGTILAAVRPFLAPEETLSDPDARELGPFARDSSTSRKAALDAYPKQGTARWKIIDALAARQDGLTRHDLEKAAFLPGNTVRPRVDELIKGGWVGETDRERKTGTGSKATVLELTAKAREELAKR